MSPRRTKKLAKDNMSAKPKFAGRKVYMAARMSKSAKAGIFFPVAKIKHMLKLGNYVPKVRDTGAVYLTAVLEYLVAEVVELAGNACKSDRMLRIQPKHILRAIRSDMDFNSMMWHTCISQAGFAPRLSFRP